MADRSDPVAALRQAVELSPDNLPLRQHLAEVLLGSARYAEAEQEYRAALSDWPDHVALKIGLARCFHQQGKLSHALVIVEDLLKLDRPPGEVYVLHARLLFRAGDPERAVRQYKQGIELDPSAGDAEFAARLGIGPADGEDADSREVIDGRVRASWDDSASDDAVEIERPGVTFADVGGMESVKEEIRLKIIHPLTHAALYQAYGKPIGGGILMYGPPGCGKTHLARATAGEIHAAFMSIGINDVLDMWIGNSERNLHEIFERARRSRPCVLFFDEVDALAASRADMRTSSGRHLINQFLSELDGMGASNEGVLVLAATNAPWHVDAAFRRPGRFDRIVFVPPPDAAARAAILRIQCHGKPVADLDFEQLAKKTEGFSGADLKSVVDLAVEAKLKAAIKTGVPQPLATRDLLSAAGGTKPSTREWFSTARNYALYSNQGGAYDDVLKYLKLN